MPITTKTGDSGQTSWQKGRVSKSSKEIIFLGLMDWAMAEVAVARITAKNMAVMPIESDLKRVAIALSDVCAILAAGVQRDLNPVLEWCTQKTQSVECTRFIDFGETNALSAAINLARTSVRLAESHLPDTCDAQSSVIRPLMNRLSDVLFVLAIEADG